MDTEQYIGYIKYDGELVKEGLMDARKQAQALIGFDTALRYFIAKQSPELQNLDFEIPLRIKKGSWELLIPETVGGWIQAGLGVVATAYFTKAAQQMAENDFKEKSIKDIFIKSVEAVKWFAKIGKHMGDTTIRKFQNVKFKNNNELIGIRNEQGEYLYIPKEFLDLYTSTNPDLLSDIAENIEEGRNLTIGTYEDNDKDEVTIYKKQKHIFCPPEAEEEEDILFPELIHGDNVVLDGEVTRENKTSNSMGFKYQGHILTAYPQSGSIVAYKSILFLKCRLYGTINRLDEKGFISSRRPKIFISHIEALEPSENDLFN